MFKSEQIPDSDIQKAYERLRNKVNQGLIKPNTRSYRNNQQISTKEIIKNPKKEKQNN